jgi:hypothetical protein
MLTEDIRILNKSRTFLPYGHLAKRLEPKGRPEGTNPWKYGAKNGEFQGGGDDGDAMCATRYLRRADTRCAANLQARFIS